MLRYWSNVFAMLGVALIATAFFQERWQAGSLLGIYAVAVGAWFYGLATRGDDQ